MESTTRLVKLAVFSPLTEVTINRGNAPRLDTLNGKTIGEVWTTGHYGADRTFPIIRRKLQERFPDVKIVPYRVRHRKTQHLPTLGASRPSGRDTEGQGMRRRPAGKRWLRLRGTPKRRGRRSRKSRHTSYLDRIASVCLICRDVCSRARSL